MAFSRSITARAKSLILLSVMLIAVGTLNGLVAGQTIVLTFAPTDDAGIRADSPNNNAGSLSTLVVDGSPVRNFLIKFNVTDVGPAYVVSAKLRLFQVDSSPRGGDFHTTSPDWSEQTVNWNNAPAADPSTIASLGAVSSGVWYEVDITPAVAGDGPVSLRVNSPHSNGAYYSSKEGANPPQLVVTVEIVVPDPFPPSQPQGLTAVAVSHTSVDLSWQESTDNVAVTGYEVYRNDSLVATVDGATTQHTDTTVSPSTPYSYAVVAFDAAENRSPPSDQVVVVTPEPPSFFNLIFTPTDDAYIMAGTFSGDGNFGTEPRLAVDNSPLRDFLLKFSVTGVDAGEVIGAKLRLFQTDSSPRGGDFRKTSSTWSERTITWNNAPASEPAVIASLGPVVSQNWYEVNVVSAIAGDGLINFRVSSPNSDGAYYSSKEGANPPQLNVTVANLAPSSLSLRASPNPSSVGELVNFSGTLTSSEGEGLPDRTVEIQSLVSTSWITIASAGTESDGSYSRAKAFASERTYQLRAMFAGDASYRATTSGSLTLNVTGTNPASFTFAAAGDIDATTATDLSLDALARSGSNFYLALGDLSYGTISPESAWCNYVTSHVGTEFPFELLAGNHESGNELHGHGLIDKFAECLPDKIGSITGIYAKEYYFDYPVDIPLARVIMISPGLNFSNGGFYSYKVGTFHYAWVSNAVDGARAIGIPWIIVGTHKVCITVGANSCQIGTDLMHLLIDKKVDLVLQGHSHSYERSGQLALSPSCTSVPIQPAPANLSCNVDTGSDDVYVKDAGTVFLIAGIGGSGLTPVDASDTEAPYFARFFGSNSPQKGHGFVKYEVSATGLSAALVIASGGPFTDGFSIVSSENDTTPPSQPQNLTAAAVSGTQVDLSWQASTDDFVVAGYDIFRNGTKINAVGGLTTTYPDTTVTSPAAYTYTVVAFDAARNPSNPSNEARIRLVTLTFLPTDDAYINGGLSSRGINYGQHSQLIVDNDPLREFLLKFNVTGIGTEQVVSANLRLFQADSSNRGGDFHTTSSDWSENTVTWNNAPAADPTVIASLGSVASNTWYEVDMTVIVSGDGVVSLRVTAASSDGAFYSSKEGSNPSQLVLVVSSTF